MSNKKCGAIALIGPPNAGKSTLFNKLLGTKLAPVTHKAQTTRRRIRGILTEDDSQFVFVDAAGIKKPEDALQSNMMRDARDVLMTADVVCLLVPAIRANVDGFLGDFVKDFEGPIILALSQVDKFKQKEELLPILQKLHDDGRFKAIVPLCATRDQGLDSLVKELEKVLPERPFMFDPESLTDMSEKDVCADLIREQLMTQFSQEIPYGCGVSIEGFDESRREDAKKPLVTIEATIHILRESQRRIILGKGGEKIKGIGKESRLTLEALLGCKVMLKLFVRISPSWILKAESMGVV